MSTVTAVTDIDESIHRAWQEYHEYLHDLGGQDYEDAKPEAWELLQDELRDIEERRRTLTGPIAE